MLAIVSLIVLMSAYLLVKQLNASAGRTADSRNHNAKVLNQAKQALIGWLAINAAGTDNNPGRLPCPEAINAIGTNSEGIAAPLVTPSTPNCATVGRLPWRTLGLDKLLDAASEPLWYVVSPTWALQDSSTLLTINSNSTGQLLVNARSVNTLSQTAGLATAVSTAHGFRTGDIVKIAGAAPAGYNVAASVTFIDANTFTYAVDPALSTPATPAAGSIKAGDAAVALIIAPGPAMNVVASADCAARSQARSVPSPTINALDYLECYDAANGVFSTTGPAASFNNQVLHVTTADLLPEIEAAIANRIEREIVPALKSVYESPLWGSGISLTNPLFPYPAPFGNPSTSNFNGAAVTVPGAPQGLLPFNQTQGCNPATDARCTTTLTAWASPSPAPPPDVTKIGGEGYFQTKTCSWQSGGNVALCQGEYHENDLNQSGPGMVISMTATINNVAMGLRRLDATKATIEAENNDATGAPLTIVTPSITRTMNSNGSVTITFSGTLPNIDVKGWESWALYRIRLERSVIGDHSLLNATSVGAGSTGWFVRNEWYRLLYYATVAGHTAASLPAAPSCTTMGTCLSVANGDPTRPITPVGGQRAILIFAGSSVVGQTRPSATPGNYFEFGNATGAFERQPVKKSPVVNAALKVPFNDRIVVLDANP